MPGHAIDHPQLTILDQLVLRSAVDAHRSSGDELQLFDAELLAQQLLLSAYVIANAHVWEPAHAIGPSLLWGEADSPFKIWLIMTMK